MLRGILGVSRRDDAKRRDSTHIIPFTDRDATNVTRRVMELAIPGTRRRGHPKKTWRAWVLGAIEVLRNAVEGGWVSAFLKKKRYGDVWFNVISVTRGWVGVKFQGKKRYVTLEWTLTQDVALDRKE